MAKPLSFAATVVLHAVAGGANYGFDLIDVTGLPGGTVYQALTRLERDGLLVSDWEDVEAARAEKRPPRRYYGITAAGIRALAAALDRYHALKPIRGIRPVRARS